MRMMLNFALWLQKKFLYLGVVIKRSNYNSREDLRLLRFLEVNEIDTVLDVGANRGDYALMLIEGGFTGRVYSFEALPEMHEKLQKRAVNLQDRWIIAPRAAVTDVKGAAKFNVTSAISSSSLLAPTEVTSDMKDIFAVSQIIDVPTITLAEACIALGISSRRIFLKLDIQGGEERALSGAEAILPQVVGIVAEMPLQIYYDGQAPARKLDAWITERGYSLWDIQAVWRHPKSGRLDHIDATYFR